MGIFFGLGAALSWGTADFCARFGGRITGAYRALLYMQPVGLVILSIYLFFFEKNLNWEWWAIGLCGVLNIMNTLGGLCLFRAMEVGTLAIVSPISSSYGAVTLTLALLSGERPALLQLAGLLVTIIGVVLSSLQPKVATFNRVERSTGAGLAIAAAFLFGFAFWGMKYVTPVIGSTVVVWENRLLAPLFLILLARPLRQTLAFPPRAAWGWIIVNGLLDTLAFVSFSAGLAGYDSAVVTVLSSLYAVVTVLLALIFLKEKLLRIQWAGVSVVILGVALVGAA